MRTGPSATDPVPTPPLLLRNERSSLPNKNAEKKNDGSIKLTEENWRMKNTYLQEAGLKSWLPSKSVKCSRIRSKD
jgi:hypothetical protein